ncbi:MAG: 23S rRNA (guanosine(2251)-2'-O)-methyltransferase RlmB [Patescibacteria group bacterium]
MEHIYHKKFNSGERLHKKGVGVYIYGKHALMEAIGNAPRAVKKVFLSPEANTSELRGTLEKNKIPFSAMKGGDAGKMVSRDASHQGVIAAVDPAEILVDFDDFVSNLKPDENTILVLLDELTDPQNVGAIIRSAAAFGASGILLPAKNQAPITGAVVKASAGMVFRVPIVELGNVNRAVDILKEKGFRVYGLDMNGEKKISDEKFGAPSLFIVGNEGRGIREKTFERCDVQLRIPMNPKCESLNASVSAAVVLFYWSLGHSGALKKNG